MTKINKNNSNILGHRSIPRSILIVTTVRMMELETLSEV